MKAIVQVAYGLPSDVLRFEDIEPPTPGADEILVSVRNAGVNWADWSATSGMPYVMRALYGLRKPRNGRLGADAAGTVEAVGTEVEDLRPGDEVFGSCLGAFAEYARGRAEDFVIKPPELSFEQAAAVPMAGLVALQALRDVGAVQHGQRVLINGASGGIGTFAVQIAKALEAEVTGVCSTGNVELVRSIGADHVIDYTESDFTELGERYDFILDIADRHSLADRRRVLTPRGTLVPNSGLGGPWFGSLGRIVKARVLSPFVSQTLKPFLSLSKPDDLAELKRLLEAELVTPVIGRTYELSETAEAVAYVGAGHARGKTIITV